MDGRGSFIGGVRRDWENQWVGKWINRWVQRRMGTEERGRGSHVVYAPALAFLSFSCNQYATNNPSKTQIQQPPILHPRLGIPHQDLHVPILPSIQSFLRAYLHSIRQHGIDLLFQVLPQCPHRSLVQPRFHHDPRLPQILLREVLQIVHRSQQQRHLAHDPFVPHVRACSSLPRGSYRSRSPSGRTSGRTIGCSTSSRTPAAPRAASAAAWLRSSTAALYARFRAGSPPLRRGNARSLRRGNARRAELAQLAERRLELPRRRVDLRHHHSLAEPREHAQLPRLLVVLQRQLKLPETVVTPDHGAVAERVLHPRPLPRVQRHQALRLRLPRG